MMKLSVSELLKKTESLENQVLGIEDNSESKIEKYKKIVAGVARKYESKWVSREDLEQELWIKVLEMLEAVDGDENKLDCNLVAKACFRKAVDYYRYCRRRYEANVKLECDDADRTELQGDLEYDPSKLLATRGLIDQNMYTMVKEIIDMFEEGSKERQYIEMKLYHFGIIDEENYGEVTLPGEPKAPKNTDDKIDFVAMLGYNNRKISGSWIRKEREMRRIIGEYLGR